MPLSTSVHILAFSPCTPLVQELKQTMARYGGFFVNYMNKDVTHIICANLPDSKLKLKERVKERWVAQATVSVHQTIAERCAGAREGCSLI